MLEELDEKLDVKRKAIIDVNPEWGFWQRFGANLVNSIPVVFWLVVSTLLLLRFNNNEELVPLRDAMLNVTISSTMYGLFSLVSILALVSWFFPYFSYRKLIQEGTPLERAACMIFWGMLSLAAGIIISAGIR